MRIAHPCSEDLPSMPRVPGGVHCTRCDRDVLDLRSTPRKHALAVLAEARQKGDGRVCAWVRATKDRELVFAPDPSPGRSRWIAPVLAIGSLAACSSSTSTREPVPVVALPPTAPATSGGNTNGFPSAPAPVVAQPTSAPAIQHPVSNTTPVIEMTEILAGDVDF